MRKTFLVVLGLLVSATVALAVPPVSHRRDWNQERLIQGLNGSPAELGQAYTTDAGPSFNTCSQSGTNFDAGFGNLAFVTCTEPQYMKPGVCTTVATAASRPIEARVEVVTLLEIDEMAIAFTSQDGGTGGRCWVGRGR